MSKNRKIWLSTFFILAPLVFGLGSLDKTTAEKPVEGKYTFQVSDPVFPKISPAVRDLVPAGVDARLDQRTLSPLWLGENLGSTGHLVSLDPLAANSVNDGKTPSPLVTFEGLGSDGLAPPDAVGDVGPNHFVQMVNVSFQIWDKGDPDNGIPPSVLQPDTLFNQLFTGFTGSCESQNDGNPIVIYDDMADRWLMSQVALTTPHWMCIAVSTTPDPTGTYYLYAFVMPTVPDYPKFGAWRDAYYLGTNSGVAYEYYAHAFDRNRMLAGLPATRQSFGGLANFVMPADADGPIPPPVDTPGIFYTMYAEWYKDHPAGVDRLALYEFDVDWETSANSTFALVQEIPIADYNYTVCGFLFQDCIPQPGTTQKLDSLSYWPMYRFQYRNFGSFAGLVGNFTVDLDGNDKAAIRWFELRMSGETYTLFQEGTYAPDNAQAHRWIGSIALDRRGNIALGYNVVNNVVGEGTPPSLWFATRELEDPPGTLAQEAELQAGEGVQMGINRWGDFANLVVDPVDGCTFWFTGEYHDSDDSGFNWNTRVGVFRIPSCEGKTGTLTGQVSDSTTGLGIPDAQIEARALITLTGMTKAGENGGYALDLPQGTYVVTATVYGYVQEVITGVEVVSSTDTLLDFSLEHADNWLVEGVVTDANAGWPLYAKITIDELPGTSVWTDPETGVYSLVLPEGDYTFKVTPWSAGYFPASSPINVSADTIQDFAMSADTDSCLAPGYVLNGMREGFDEGILPSGWTIIDNTAPPTGQVWRFDDPGNRGNLTGGSGPFAIVDSDFEEGMQDTELHTPPMDFTDHTSVRLAFDTDLNFWDDGGGNEIADVDIQINSEPVWMNIWRRTTADGNLSGHVELDISAIAAGANNVMIRFHYYDAYFDYWWEVDNVEIGALTCDPLPGGLVVGRVTDLNTSSALNGAQITNEAGATALTVDTPDDPQLGGGFYLLFSDPGSQIYTATLSSDYGTLTETVAIGDGQTVRVDYPLPAGWLVGSPSTLELHLGMGYSAELFLEIENIGSREASYLLLESEMGEDFPWLIPQPITGSVETGNTDVITITLDTTSGITQTGTYSTALDVKSDTPYDSISTQVIMIAEEPFGAVDAGPNQARSGAPGESLFYTVTVTNTGNIPETFNFEPTTENWLATLSETGAFLNPGRSMTFLITVRIPGDAWHLDEDHVVITVSGVNLQISDSVSITSTALFPHEIYLPLSTKSSSSE